MNRNRKETVTRFKLALVWMLLMVLVIGESLVYTWSRVQCVKVGYEITQASRIYEKRVALQKAMEVELALLTSPSRIIQQAQEKLGLVRPSPEQVITIR